jgi:hypothetical protein
VNQYFKETAQRLQQDGIIKQPWPESMKVRLKERVKGLNETLESASPKERLRDQPAVEGGP